MNSTVQLRAQQQDEFSKMISRLELINQHLEAGRDGRTSRR